MSSLSFVRKTFDWGGEMVLAVKCRDWAKIAPQRKYVEKALISRQTLGYFSTLDLTQTFE